MAEIQSLEGQINGGGGVGGSLLVATSENFSSKRQRRPSVRLGDIGDQQFDSHLRRTKQWNKVPLKDSSTSGKGSKTRALTHIGSSGGGDFLEIPEDEDKEGNLDSVVIGSWKVRPDSKTKRGLTTKRVRSNWVSKVDEGGGVDEEGNGERDDKYSGGGGGGEDVDDDDGFIRDFDPQGSESPLKEQSPIRSLDNMAVDIDRGHSNDREVLFHGQRRHIRARVSEGIEEHHDGVELSGPSETDARDWKCGTSADLNGNSGRGRSHEDGAVRIWLHGLGLGRYAPVFEIHEVDDEVLPMLTLEDLKDMGINAVGSRRKMYCAIQKLGKGFS